MWFPLVSFAERSGADPAQELSKPLPDNPVATGIYKFVTGEAVTVIAKDNGVGVIRGGITYPAVRVGSGIRYVPGLDVYVAGADGGGLQWLSSTRTWLVLAYKGSGRVCPPANVRFPPKADIDQQPKA